MKLKMFVEFIFEGDRAAAAKAIGVSQPHLRNWIGKDVGEVLELKDGRFIIAWKDSKIFRLEDEWLDMNGTEIKSGDKLYNKWNEPEIVEVLTDGTGLYLGDMDTPFDSKYCFERFWVIKNESADIPGFEGTREALDALKIKRGLEDE